MIRLDTTTRKLQVVLAGAVSTNQLPVVVSYSDKTSTTYNGATQTAQTNGTTAVDICAAPASSTIRDVDYINIYNADTSEATITVRCNDNGTLYQLVKTTLKVGSQITYTHSSGWQMMLSDGSIKSGSSFWGGISGTLSDQSDLQSTVESLSPALTYGINQYTSSGLTWGYYGGNVTLSNGTMSKIANGTLTLTASATNYVVANKATGAVSASTSTTNWNDSVNYWRLYSVVVGAATVTSYADSRELAKYTGSSDLASLGAEAKANRDASGGYVGLTLFKINFRNAANTFTSFFTNTNTAARTYTLPDKDGTVAMTSDITGTNSGTNTGDETAATIKSKLGITTLSGSNTGDQTLEGLGGVPAVSPSTSGTLTHSGDIVVSGSARRITADFGNATLNNRAMFQNSTTNGITAVRFIPNGTATISAIQVGNSSDPSNSSYGELFIGPSDVRLSSSRNGSGAFLPFNFQIGTSLAFKIGVNLSALAVSTGGLGYGEGAGGSCIQPTSRATNPPAINFPNGDITLFTAAGSATPQTITVSNSCVGLYDVPIIAVRGATNKYITAITNIVAGVSFDITFWTTGGTASDTPIFHFNLCKGSIT